MSALSGCWPHSWHAGGSAGLLAYNRSKKMTRWQKYNLTHPERRKASAKRYRDANKEKRAAYTKDWKARNTARNCAKMKEWRTKQPKQYWKLWKSWKPKTGLGRWPTPGRTYEQTLAANRVLRNKMCQNLSDSYLRGWMSRTTGNRIKPSEWPDSLVELKRAQLKLKRICLKSPQTTL